MTLRQRCLALGATTALALFGATGCSRDAEVLGFVVDFDTFSDEIVKRVKQAKDPSAGVDDAQKYLDSQKADIKKKLAALKEVRNFQISADTKKKIETSMTKNAEAVAGLMLNYVMRMATDKPFRAKLEKLIDDYKNTVTQ